MPNILIQGEKYWLRTGEYKVVKRIFACIKGAKQGLMPGGKPARKAANFLACAPDSEALCRRAQVINAMGIQEFYYKDALEDGTDS